MQYTDLIILAIIALFFAHGFKRGLIQVVGGFVGILLGSYLAGLILKHLVIVLTSRRSKKILL